jgi:hypothetical protein
MTKELYRTIWTLLTSIILTGVIFGFKFIDDVEVQFHDTYIIVFPIYFGLGLWIILSFIVFLIVGLKTKFARIAATWILLLINSILTLLMIVLTYRAYTFFVADILLDTFRETKRIDAISGQFYFIMITGLLATCLFFSW